MKTAAQVLKRSYLTLGPGKTAAVPPKDCPDLLLETPQSLLGKNYLSKVNGVLLGLFTSSRAGPLVHPGFLGFVARQKRVPRAEEVALQCIAVG